MTDLQTIIRARFLEAADTERRLPFAKIRPDGYGSSMPAYVHSFADKVGWGKDRLEEERRMISRRLPPSAGAISRHDECLRWTALILPNAGEPEAYRRALWALSFSQVVGRSFRAWCRAEGVAHVTGYRRAEAAVGLLSSILRHKSHLLIKPDEEWVLQAEAGSGINSGMVGDSTGRSPKHWRAADADPANTDNEMVREIAAKQAAERERRRREKLGVAA